MAAVVQICDSHLTEGFEVGKNFTDSSITDLLRDVSANNLRNSNTFRYYPNFRLLPILTTQCLFVNSGTQ